MNGIGPPRSHRIGVMPRCALMVPPGTWRLLSTSPATARSSRSLRRPLRQWIVRHATIARRASDQAARNRSGTESAEQAAALTSGKRLPASGSAFVLSTSHPLTLCHPRMKRPVRFERFVHLRRRHGFFRFFDFFRFFRFFDFFRFFRLFAMQRPPKRQAGTGPDGGV